MAHGKRLTTFRQLFFRFAREDRAGAQILTAMAMPLIIGFAGLGIDGANWLAQKRLTQNIADSAAIAAGHSALDHEAGVTGILSVQEDAMAEAIRSGYENNGDNILNIRLLSAPATNGIRPRVEVEVVREAPVYFAGLFIDKQPTVAARAVSGTREMGNNCVIGLNETAPKTVYFTGNTIVTIACGVTSNSESSQSMYVTGNAKLLANPAQAAGDIVIAGNGQIISDLPLMPFHSPTPDPLGGRIFPQAPASCDQTDFVVDAFDSVPLEPPSGPGGMMKLCGGADIRGDLDLAPGTYYLHNGDVTINSTATVQCSTCIGGQGVTLVISGDTPASIGDIHVNGGATVTLDAPDSGPFKGVVVYKDRQADGSGDNRFNGGNAMQLNGMVYFPTELMYFVGGADVEGCTYLISDMIEFSGDEMTTVRADDQVCIDIGLADEIQQTQQRLVVLLE